MGLKSLTEIKQTFDLKKLGKNKKNVKNKSKSGSSIRNSKSPNFSQLEDFECMYQQKLLLEQAKELTTLVKKMAKQLDKIENKLAKITNC